MVIIKQNGFTITEEKDRKYTLICPNGNTETFDKISTAIARMRYLQLSVLDFDYECRFFFQK